jgi:hypothetical protein
VNHQLPTFTSASWTVTGLLDSLKSELTTDAACNQMRFFAYAVTLSGWQEIRDVFNEWKGRVNGRNTIGYVGTDHALTDPEAIRQMQKDGIEIRVMTAYNGVFHPKVFWLSGPRSNLVWVGSNNLTRDGLIQNIEFSTLIKSQQDNPDLRRWFDSVQSASEPISDALLKNYEDERRVFAAKRSATGTFTWSMRREAPRPPAAPAPGRNRTPSPATVPVAASHSLPGIRGDLVVEVMPLETGLDGKQMQLPKAAVVRFFGLADHVGATRRVTLTPIGTAARRALTITIFANNTARLSINELDYRDRPCVIVFHKTGNAAFQFEIVRQSIYPGRYRTLLARCANQTRQGSRRWIIL